LSERSAENYTSYLRNHIGPYIGDEMLVNLKPPRVRAWRKQLQDNNVGAPTIAKVYRFLHSVLATAEDDELIRRNPCRIKGTGQEKSPERPTATLPEVFAIAAAIQSRYRLLVLLAAFGQLRFGELLVCAGEISRCPHGASQLRLTSPLGLTPHALSTTGFPCSESTGLSASSTTVRGASRDRSPMRATGRLPSRPRSCRNYGHTWLPRAHRARAGWATVLGAEKGHAEAAELQPDLEKCCQDAGANPDLHLHDLRHTGGTLTAQSGATLKEIMARLGHSSTRAAMIYQHSTDERDRQIADALNAMIEGARRQSEQPSSAITRTGEMPCRPYMSLVMLPIPTRATFASESAFQVLGEPGRCRDQRFDSDRNASALS
jgi:integrase